jgi:hypothetical protein
MPPLERDQAMSESIFRTQCHPLIEEGTLFSRVYQLYGKLEFPPELLATRNLKLLQQFAEQEKAHHAIIDTDHFVEPQVIVKVLTQELHSCARV